MIILLWVPGLEEVPCLELEFPVSESQYVGGVTEGCQPRSATPDHSATSLNSPAQKRGFRKRSCEGETTGSSHMGYQIMLCDTGKKTFPVFRKKIVSNTCKNFVFIFNSTVI
jgi:hypothetical protein